MGVCISTVSKLEVLQWLSRITGAGAHTSPSLLLYMNRIPLMRIFGAYHVGLSRMCDLEEKNRQLHVRSKVLTIKSIYSRVF